MTVQKQIGEAAAAYARRDFVQAERACRAVLDRDPRNGDACHLLGLVRRQLGDTAGAERLLRDSIALVPRRAEYRINFSNLLSAEGRLAEAEAELRAALAVEPDSRLARLTLSRLLNRGGAQTEAEAEARALLAVNPADAEAWAALASAERDQDRLADAESSFRRALESKPDYPIARHNLGAVLSRLKRSEDALAELDRAAAQGLTGPELACNRGKALMDLGRFDDASRVLTDAVAAAPAFVDAQVTLAKLRHMLGEREFARSLTEAADSGDFRLRLALGDLQRRAGQLDAALETLRGLAASFPDNPAVQSSLAVVLQEYGRPDVALAHARSAHAALPGDTTVTENLVAVLLQLGEAAEARPLILDQGQRSPLDQRWLAYEATAERLLGHSRYEALYDYERFVKVYDLDAPPGLTSIEAFNVELAERLLSMHQLNLHPLDQSLRNGTQTPRDLLTVDDAIVARFLEALSEPIRAYREALGHDAAHPFLARNDGEISLTGCWSVRLRRGGFHVNHIHPEGWISSAYYVDVPPEVADENRRSGWIKFGEPRLPVPEAEPAHYVQPQVGRLVLFPSYMWHGTTPIDSDAERLTIAFDARPG